MRPRTASAACRKGALFHELHDGDQCESPGSFDGRAIVRKQMRERVILGDGSERIAHLQGEIPAGKSGTSYTDSFLRDRECALWLQGHLSAPLLAARFQRLLAFSLLAN
jgi:hypothetical protein